MPDDIAIKTLVVMKMDIARTERLDTVLAELEPLGASSAAGMSLNDQLFARQELIKRSQDKKFASQESLDSYLAKCDKIIRLAWDAGIFAALSWLEEPEELLDRVLDRNANLDHDEANAAFGSPEL